MSVTTEQQSSHSSLFWEPFKSWADQVEASNGLHYDLPPLPVHCN
jgi:hypothetical protein